MLTSLSSFFGRLSLVALVAAAGVGCARPPPSVEPPPQLSFHPCAAGAELWLATSIAVEVKNERDARLLEAEDPLYVGEIGIRGGKIAAANVALLAAEYGATHFRVQCAGDERHVDVILYRLERARWSSLPETLRPAMLNPRARFSSLESSSEI